MEVRLRRNAMVIPYRSLKLVDWIFAIRAVSRGISENRLSLLAGSVAFFGMLAMFPALAALVSFYGYLAEPEVILENFRLLEPILPDDLFELVERRLVALLDQPHRLGVTSLIGLALATWSARAGVNALIAGLNIIFKAENNRGFFRTQAIAYGLTLVLILVAIVTVVSFVVLPTLLAYLPLGALATTVLEVLRWTIGLAAMVFGLGMLYRNGPCRLNQLPPLLTAGVFVAIVTWITASSAFSQYVRIAANYHEVYGSLGTVVATLIWFYISAFILFLGAELDVALEERARDKGLIP